MTRHLAEFNLGILKHDWDDPRVADFVNNIDRVNAIAARSPGFVWRMPDEEMDAGQMGVDPRMASTLSVWQDGASLENFVWNTIHKKFFDRRAEWYDMGCALRMVLWWVPVGHRPDFTEGMARFRHLEEHGASGHAFGWAELRRTEGRGDAT